MFNKIHISGLHTTISRDAYFYGLRYDDIVNISNLLITAGERIMAYYNADAYSVMYKQDKSVLTEADLASNAILVKGLQEISPAIPIISEENEMLPYEKRQKWKQVWIIDPLDGTKEFVGKTGEFCINVALIDGHTSVIGFVYLPDQQSMYIGIKGNGSYKYEKGEWKINQTKSFDIAKKGVRVVSSRYHTDSQTLSLIEKLDSPVINKLGSGLKFLSIARGETEYYPRMIQIMEWDTAAGQIIIEEAGGSMVDAHSGEALQYNKPSLYNPPFIASGNSN